jgi:hypothetical protein
MGRPGSAKNGYQPKLADGNAGMKIGPTSEFYPSWTKCQAEAALPSKRTLAIGCSEGLQQRKSLFADGLPGISFLDKTPRVLREVAP